MSLVWQGPCLGIEPGTSHTRSQHSTTRFVLKSGAGVFVQITDILNGSLNSRISLHCLFHLQCTAHDTQPNSVYENEVPQHFLMDTNVDSVHKRPIFYKHGVQLMKIIAGEKIGDSRNIYVSSGKWCALRTLKN